MRENQAADIERDKVMETLKSGKPPVTAPELYLLKKEVSRIVAKERGISWKEAFDSIPDEFISRYTYQSIASEFLVGAQPKPVTKSQTKRIKAQSEGKN